MTPALRPEARAYLRRVLTDRLRDLRRDLRALDADGAPIAPDDSYGRVSRMDAIQNQSVQEAGARSARERAAKLGDALERLDRPDFGRCAACGEPIDLDRLIARPESRRCVPCSR